MKFLVVSSIKDIAGVNIHNYIKKNFSKIDCILIEEETTDSSNLDNLFKGYDFFIFATRHQSQKNSKTLSVHAPGNWNNADYGGEDFFVCNTSSYLLKYSFNLLKENSINSEFETTLEVTHHGPKIDTPCIFIEIGSTILEWENPNAVKIIAQTINQIVTKFSFNLFTDWIPCVAIGGPHYCPAFNKIQYSSKYAISHIIPKYVFPITKNTFLESIKKTKEEVKTVILDWNGLKSEDRNFILKSCKELNLNVLRSNSI